MRKTSSALDRLSELVDVDLSSLGYVGVTFCVTTIDAGNGPLRSDTVKSSLTQPVANRTNTSQPRRVFCFYALSV